MCNTLLNEIESAINFPRVFDANETDEKQETMTNEEMFSFPITFMEHLVTVSKKLATLPAPHYKTEVEAMLSLEDKFLRESPAKHSGAFGYIPLFKPVGSADFHRIIRICPGEAIPIPTYGRVLVYLWMEVIDMEKVELSDDTLKKLKKKEKKKRKKEEEKKKKEEPNTNINNKEGFKELGSSKELYHTNSPQEGSPIAVRRDSLSISGNHSNQNLSVNTTPQTHHTVIPSSKGQAKASELKVLGSHQAFGEPVAKKMKRIASTSPYGNLPGWRIQPLIVKYGEEVLQEEFAMQCIIQFQRIFYESKVPAILVPYRILAVSAKSGLIEPVPNCLSLDTLKKNHTNLLHFFIQVNLSLRFFIFFSIIYFFFCLLFLVP